MSSVNLDEIADSDPELQERVQYPIEWTEIDDEDESIVEIRDAAVDEIETIDPDNLVVLVGDFGDCDGKGTAGVLKAKYADTDTEVVYVPASHRTESISPLKGLKSVQEVVPEGVPIYYTDLSPNEEQIEEYKNILLELSQTNPLFVRDHHPWPKEVMDALEGTTKSLVVDDDQENPVCATQIVIREDWPDAPEYIKELGEVTAVRDLWKKDLFDEEPRNSDLSEYAFVADYGEYSDAVAKHGADIRNDDEIREIIDSRRQEKEDRIQFAVDNFTEWFDIDNWKVALTYGNCYPSGLGDALIEEGADLVGVIKPNGTVSMRSAKETPLAYQVATSIGGGGHPSAAGCDPDVVVGSERYKRLERGNDNGEEIPYVRYHDHWNTAGQFTKRVMLSNILQALKGIETVTDLPYVDENGEVDMSLVDESDVARENDEEKEEDQDSQENTEKGEETESDTDMNDTKTDGTTDESGVSTDSEDETQPSLTDF